MWTEYEYDPSLKPKPHEIDCSDWWAEDTEARKMPDLDDSSVAFLPFRLYFNTESITSQYPF